MLKQLVVAGKWKKEMGDMVNFYGNVNECPHSLNTLNGKFLMKSCVLNALKFVIVDFLKG